MAINDELPRRTALPADEGVWAPAEQSDPILGLSMMAGRELADRRLQATVCTLLSIPRSALRRAMRINAAMHRALATTSQP